MERRFVLFLVLATAILFGYSQLVQRRGGQRPPAAKDAAGKPDKQPAEKPLAEKPPAEQPAAEKPKPEKPPEVAKPAAEPKQPQRWLMLGSADPDDPYRMLVTLTTRGAALVRVELSSERYRDLEDRSGHLGHVAFANAAKDGCLVQAVGPGTPADKAGLRGDRWVKLGDTWGCEPGDLITAVAGRRVLGPEGLAKALRETKPGETVELTIRRDGHEQTVEATLGRRPLEVVRPEAADPNLPDAPLDGPPSLLLTLQQLDDRQLELGEQVAALGRELKGLDLWGEEWEVAAADEQQVQFRRALPAEDLEILKTYRLARVPAEAQDRPHAKAYHLELQVEIRNRGKEMRKIAYQLDGPNGLPVEGAWYASKVSPSSGNGGMRDMVISLSGRKPELIHCLTIAEGKAPAPYRDEPVSFVGVDGQYFAAILLPQTKEPNDLWFAKTHALRVGEAYAKDKRLTNVSCRLISIPVEIKPGESLRHGYTLFAGPKQTDLLAQYEFPLPDGGEGSLKGVVYYGWPIFAVVAVPLVKVLHVLYWLVPNYGVAIILLTVLVRGCMFPLSRKQALNAQKMQQLAPEIKRIQEKYKKDVEARTKAQQQLYREHNFNPLGGCLVLFIQLPIFMGLYRALMIDVDLRQAPLLSENIRWCSNLAAPDMLLNWSGFMPGFIVSWLGPYLNVLPIVTVAIFNWQQKKMMPPPTDEQQAMQQKIMQYMMIFMGLLFYKVASGLCIYFVASSLWGMLERQFLPKAAPVGPARPQTRADAKAAARAADTGKKPRP
jgi:YidC/Oxa1 family membrane protein insertase